MIRPLVTDIFGWLYRKFLYVYYVPESSFSLFDDRPGYALLEFVKKQNDSFVCIYIDSVLFYVDRSCVSGRVSRLIPLKHGSTSIIHVYEINNNIIPKSSVCTQISSPEITFSHIPRAIQYNIYKTCESNTILWDIFIPNIHSEGTTEYTIRTGKPKSSVSSSSVFSVYGLLDNGEEVQTTISLGSETINTSPPKPVSLNVYQMDDNLYARGTFADVSVLINARSHATGENIILGEIASGVPFKIEGLQEGTWSIYASLYYSSDADYMKHLFRGVDASVICISENLTRVNIPFVESCILSWKNGKLVLHTIFSNVQSSVIATISYVLQSGSVVTSLSRYLYDVDDRFTLPEKPNDATHVRLSWSSNGLTTTQDYAIPQT